MILLRKKTDAPSIQVEAKIIGIIAGRYLSVVENVALADGSSIKDLLSELHKSGRLDETAYRQIKGIKPPLTLLVNGAPINGRGREKTKLASGDSISILTPLTGG